jgi:hypothetical protein
MVGWPCDACLALTPYVKALDFSQIETRIMGLMMTFVMDKYGTESKAKAALRKALKAERRYEELGPYDKEEFFFWIAQKGEAYEDGDGIDWIGGFYDWLDER